jgi:hypothetical protein
MFDYKLAASLFHENKYKDLTHYLAQAPLELEPQVFALQMYSKLRENYAAELGFSFSSAYSQVDLEMANGLTPHNISYVISVDKFFRDLDIHPLSARDVPMDYDIVTEHGKSLTKTHKARRLLDARRNEIIANRHVCGLLGNCDVTKLTSLGENGLYAFKYVPGFDEFTKDLVIKKTNHTPTYYLWVDHLAMHLGESNIAVPTCSSAYVSPHSNSIKDSIKTEFHLMQNESADLEHYLRTCDDASGISLIWSCLQKQFAVSQVLENSREDSKIGLKRNVGPFSMTLSYEIPVYDYMAEFTKSVITGRTDDDERIMPKAKLANGNYVRGQIPTVDNLVTSARILSESFLGQRKMVNIDSQPSNFFINGKVHDLDRLVFAHPFMSVARLLSHPVTQTYLEKFSVDEQLHALSRFGLPNLELLNRKKSRITNVPLEIYFQSINASARDRENYDEIATWINCSHVVTMASRVKDAQRANEYLAQGRTHIRANSQSHNLKLFGAAFEAALLESKFAKDFICDG